MNDGIGLVGVMDGWYALDNGGVATCRTIGGPGLAIHDAEDKQRCGVSSIVVATSCAPFEKCDLEV